MTNKQLRVNPILCEAHGVCAELLPELIRVDPWGYPIFVSRSVPPELEPLARRAVASCPTLALLLERVAGAPNLAHRFQMTIDWAALRAAAVAVAGRAYAPYSRLRVGAAGLTGDGRVLTGCNVENASFGLTLCAECGLVSALHATAPAPPPETNAPPTPPPTPTPPTPTPTLVAVAVVAGDGAPLLPCGRCRQLLLEAGGPALLIDTAAGPVPLAELLPAAFDGADLSARREPAAT